MRRHGYSLTPLLLFSWEEWTDKCLNFSHCSLNQRAIGTLSTSRSSTVLPSLSSLPTCMRAFSMANERLCSSDRSFPVTIRTFPCNSSSVCLSDNPTERQSLSIRRNSASMGNHSFALSMMRLRLPTSRSCRSDARNCSAVWMSFIFCMSVRICSMLPFSSVTSSCNCLFSLSSLFTLLPPNRELMPLSAAVAVLAAEFFSSTVFASALMRVSSCLA